jgi:anti-sigma factor RsiW
MTSKENRIELECRQARHSIQKGLDGLLDDGSRKSLELHLDRCSDCRNYEKQLKDVQQALTSLPSLEFPDEALGEVWSRTVDSRPPAKAWWYRQVSWRPAVVAATAILVMAVAGWFGLQRTFRPVPDSGPVRETLTHHGNDRLRIAAEEARYVLELTSRALRRSEQAAMEGVLAGQVSPALQRIVVDWPVAPKNDNGRQGV